MGVWKTLGRNMVFKTTENNEGFVGK